MSKLYTVAHVDSPTMHLIWRNWEEAKIVFERVERNYLRGQASDMPTLYYAGRKVDPYVYGIGKRWNEDHASGMLSSVGISRKEEGGVNHD